MTIKFLIFAVCVLLLLLTIVYFLYMSVRLLLSLYLLILLIYLLHTEVGRCLKSKKKLIRTLDKRLKQLKAKLKEQLNA